MDLSIDSGENLTDEKNDGDGPDASEDGASVDGASTAVVPVASIAVVNEAESQSGTVADRMCEEARSSTETRVNEDATRNDDDESATDEQLGSANDISDDDNRLVSDENNIAVANNDLAAKNDNLDDIDNPKDDAKCFDIVDDWELEEDDKDEENLLLNASMAIDSLIRSPVSSDKLPEKDSPNAVGCHSADAGAKELPFMTNETVRAQLPNELAGDSSTTNNSDVTSEETESPNATTITADRTPRTTSNLQDLAERSPRSTKRKNVSQPYGGKNARGSQGVDGKKFLLRILRSHGP